MLLQAKNMVDTRLEEVSTISDYVSRDPDLISVLKYDKEFARENLLDIYKLCKSIPHFQLSNSIIDKIYIICKNSDLVIAPGSSCEYTEKLHDSLFHNIGYDYDEWRNFIWNNRLPNNYVVLENNGSDTYSNLVYLRGLPDELSTYHSGALYISIKNDFFVDMLKKIDTDKQGLVFIMDDNGNVVSSFKEEKSALELETVFLQISNQSPNPELDNYIINSVKSDMNSWTYYSIIPKSVILSQVSTVRKMILALTLIVFIMGCIIAYKLASKKAFMLKKIIQYLSDAPTEKILATKGHNEYQYIEMAVSNLVSNNKGLKERLQEQKNAIRNSIMRTLMFVDFHDKKGFNNLINHVDIDLTGKKFVVLTISIVNMDHLLEDSYGIIHLLFKEIAEQFSNNQMDIVDVDNKTMAATMMFDNSLTSDQCYEFVDSFATAVYDECLSKYNVVLKFGVSLLYDNISKMHKAYEQSKQILDSLLSDKDNDSYILNGRDYTPQANLYYYPIEVELKLIQFVKCGDVDLLQDLLQEIYLENFKKRNLSQTMKKQLVFAMRGTIIRSLQNTTSNDKIDKMINELDMAVSMEDIFYYANEISLEICRIVDAKRIKDDERLKRDILQYIEESYSDYNFSINDIASQFDFSEHGIYQYFRENIRVSFSTLLESKRIEKACELIKKTDMHIKDIALNIGYNNDITFRRAFKRVMGILPSEYKKVVGTE